MPASTGAWSTWSTRSLDLMDVVQMLQALAGDQDGAGRARAMERRGDGQARARRRRDDADVPVRAERRRGTPRGGRDALSARGRARHGGHEPRVEVRHHAELPAHRERRTSASSCSSKRRRRSQQLEAIAAVDGVDAIFIGPADLSARMGYVGQFTHPAVIGLMSQAVQRCKAIGKPVGTLGSAPDVSRSTAPPVSTSCRVGSDLGLMMRGAQAVVAALRTPRLRARAHARQRHADVRAIEDSRCRTP